MPLNCPLDFGLSRDCTECSYQFEDKCYACKPHQPIIEILTIDERLTRLESQQTKTESQWTRQQWDRVQQLEAELRHWEAKVLQLTGKKKKGKY